MPFTGNALVQSYQIHIDHQMTFVPFIGHAFDRGFVYLGAGPTLTRIRTDLNGLIGFADLNGNRTDVSGAPINLTSKSWVLGGAAMVGATYFLDPTWFVDAELHVRHDRKQHRELCEPVHQSERHRRHHQPGHHGRHRRRADPDPGDHGDDQQTVLSAHRGAARCPQRPANRA